MCVRREASHSDSDVTAVLGPGVKRRHLPGSGGGGQSAILGDVTARSGLGGGGTKLVWHRDSVTVWHSWNILFGGPRAGSATWGCSGTETISAVKKSSTVQLGTSTELGISTVGTSTVRTCMLPECVGVSPIKTSMALDTWAEKFESLDRKNSMRVTNESFDSCNSCKRLGTSRAMSVRGPGVKGHVPWPAQGVTDSGARSVTWVKLWKYHWGCKLELVHR